MYYIDILLYKNKWLIANNRNINEVEEKKKLKKIFGLWNSYDIIILLHKLIINCNVLTIYILLRIKIVLRFLKI